MECVAPCQTSFAPNASVMDVKGFIIDQLGHFSAYDLPEVLFVIVVAAFLGYILARWGARQTGTALKQMAFWAAAAALAAVFVRSQLPMAALMLAAAVLAGKRGQELGNDALFFSVLVVGIGCGSGATVVVVLALIPYLFLMRWAFGPAPRA